MIMSNIRTGFTGVPLTFSVNKDSSMTCYVNNKTFHLNHYIGDSNYKKTMVDKILTESVWMKQQFYWYKIN